MTTTKAVRVFNLLQKNPPEWLATMRVLGWGYWSRVTYVYTRWLGRYCEFRARRN